MPFCCGLFQQVYRNTSESTDLSRVFFACSLGGESIHEHALAQNSANKRYTSASAEVHRPTSIRIRSEAWFCLQPGECRRGAETTDILALLDDALEHKNDSFSEQQPISCSKCFHWNTPLKCCTGNPRAPQRCTGQPAAPNNGPPVASISWLSRRSDWYKRAWSA